MHLFVNKQSTILSFTQTTLLLLLSFRLLFNKIYLYSRLGRILHRSSKEPLEIAGASFLQPGCPYYHPTTSVKAFVGFPLAFLLQRSFSHMSEHYATAVV